MNREPKRSARSRSPRFDSLESRSLMSLWSPSGLAVGPGGHPQEAKAVVAIEAGEGLGRHRRRPVVPVGDRLAAPAGRLAAPAGRLVALRGTMSGTVSLTPLGGSSVQLDLDGSGAASGLGRFTLTYSHPAAVNPTTTPHQLTTIGGEVTLVAENGARLTLAIFAAGTIDDSATAFAAEIGGTLIAGTRQYANASGVALGQMTADLEAGTFTMDFVIHLSGVRPARR